jgi:hypothetical protein
MPDNSNEDTLELDGSPTSAFSFPLLFVLVEDLVSVVIFLRLGVSLRSRCNNLGSYKCISISK